jgi:hypothetical protein
MSLSHQKVLMRLNVYGKQLKATFFFKFALKSKTKNVMKTSQLHLSIMVLIAMMFTISCADNDVEQTKNKFVNCVVEGMAVDATQDCSIATLDTSIFCEIVSVDSIFELTVEERKWMPYYCLDINDKIYFVDSLGNETYFLLRNKNRNLATGFPNGFDKCTESESKTRLYCVNYENIFSRVYSELLDQELFLKLSVEFDRPFKLPLETGAILEIRTGNTNHLTAFVDPGDLNNVHASNLIFYDEIELLGEKFYNVHTSINSWQSSSIPMYYNKEFGIVGFRDQTKKLWKVKR